MIGSSVLHKRQRLISNKPHTQLATELKLGFSKTATFLPLVSYLSESDILGVFSKALTADVQVVFADNTPLVATHSAAGCK